MPFVLDLAGDALGDRQSTGAVTGTTPLRWLHEQRILHARRLLEQSDLPVDDVAARSGFGTATTLREHFSRSVHTTPTAYRRAFSAAAP